MHRSPAIAPLADLAEEQWGLFTRRQAESTGMAWSTLSRMATDETTAQRVAHGVYRLRGAPPTDHLDLRAAWLQLAPAVPAWERTADTGVVSHRSAASLYELGHLPADLHEFVLPTRRQTRRPDVRLHRARLTDDEHTVLRGLPVTRPARTAADLLTDNEDPGAVGHVLTDALRVGHEHPTTVAQALAPHAARFGLRRRDGAALLRWLLDLVGAPERRDWLDATLDQEGSTPPP
ncbi:hypothetical protein FZ103_11615 [Streptomonospora sp. PA3]|uniref:type IV toxin-antitoxin system AbiEi family antitoxin domain-containing protein n=1 Tax=Streptomonospora sp. PA3 TaxID=2607326 RepID=UPI0012DF450A|nr:type IV toxin-antitoxin system AbiEi family antitoxin domain-containing protein [Streptomonospora sp. PA3]MUL41815.1 hypothetical protein [Streptomonospora sp. PA3]